jgi:hypothetical protein
VADEDIVEKRFIFFDEVEVAAFTRTAEYA